VVCGIGLESGRSRLKFEKTPLSGSYVIDVEPISDERGFFSRVWCQREFTEHGLETGFVQTNLAGTRKKATIRGFHYQMGDDAEVKLVRCIKGSIFDVAIDLRKDSPSYGKWYGVELSADNHRMFYIPKGCAHGYQTLTEDSETLYQVSAFYAPGSERGIRWDDEYFSVDWPIKENINLSEKDRQWPDYKE